MSTNGEMSRRSARLGTRDLPDDDAASTSSTGSTGTGQVSYRETPVRIFKRKTGGRKQAGASRTSSRASSVSSETVTQSNEPVQTDRYPSVLSSPSVRSPASVLRSPLMRSSTSSSHQQLEPPGFSSGYSSSEEAYYRHSPSASASARAKATASSLQSPAPAEFDLRDALRSPAQSLVMVYWWMGSAWYSLTSGLSALDVFLLSRRTAKVRKALLLILLFLLLAFGIWYWYPHISRSLSRLSVKSKPSPVQQAQTPPVQHHRVLDHIPSASLSALKEEIYKTLREQETRWSDNSARDLESIKREITVLKQDEEKQRQAAEMLQSEIKTLQNDRVKITSVQSEEQSSLGQELAGVQQQITVLRAEVSELRAASDSLQDRITSQEASQIKAAALLKEELVSWLLEKLASERQHQPQPQPQPLPLPEDVVLQPHLQEALEALEQRLLKRLAEEKQESEKLDAWRTVGETLQREGVGAVTVQDVEQIVQRALSLYRADGIGMADYALESSGASVINTRCSETYRTRSACLSLFGFPLWYHSESPRTVIQPELYPGKCWAFRGSEGFLVIALSYPVRITHVSLEHLPKVLSPTGRIDSAPRNFAVYGMSSEHEEGSLLGTFTYDQDSKPIQTFKLPAPAKDVYRMVELRILSNWGHQEYTCVYRFRVHGQAQVDGGREHSRVAE